jgi:hypothetical protein
MQPEEPIDPARIRRRASTALFLGVIALVSSLVLVGGLIGIAAIVLGRRAARQIAAHRASGLGMARGGVILGWLATIAAVLALIVYIGAAQLKRHRPHPAVHPTSPTSQLHP